MVKNSEPSIKNTTEVVAEADWIRAAAAVVCKMEKKEISLRIPVLFLFLSSLRL